MTPTRQAPSIAQLVERRTVEKVTGILRSLVRLRLEGGKLFPAHFIFNCQVVLKRKKDKSHIP